MSQSILFMCARSAKENLLSTWFTLITDIITRNNHSFIKSWFFGMQQFSSNPAGILYIERYFENLQRQKNPQNPQALGFIIESPL